MDDYIPIEKLEDHIRREKVRKGIQAVKSTAGRIGSGIVNFGKGVSATGKSTGSGLQKLATGFQKFRNDVQQSEWGKRLKQSQEQNRGFSFGRTPQQKGKKQNRNPFEWG